MPDQVRDDEGGNCGRPRTITRPSPLSAGIPAQPPAAMFDMGGLADDAFGQDDFAHRPADRRHLVGVRPVAAIVDRDVRFRGGAVHDRRPFGGADG